MLVSIFDSYVSYVAKRLLTLNARVSLNGSLVAQPFGGIVTVQDWPQSQVSEGALYLVTQRMVPTGKSKTQRSYTCFAQWTWLLIGTDIPADAQAENRGDRYRSNQQIMQNLKEANYPGFCQKIDYSADPVTGVVSGVAAKSVYPPSAYERIVWDDLDFMPRNDNSPSGVLYYAAGVKIVGWEDMVCAADITLADTRGPQIA